MLFFLKFGFGLSLCGAYNTSRLDDADWVNLYNRAKRQHYYGVCGVVFLLSESLGVVCGAIWGLVGVRGSCGWSGILKSTVKG